MKAEITSYINQIYSSSGNLSGTKETVQVNSYIDSVCTSIDSSIANQIMVQAWINAIKTKTIELNPKNLSILL
jgi:hypothetical protein